MMNKIVSCENDLMEERFISGRVNGNSGLLENDVLSLQHVKSQKIWNSRSAPEQDAKKKLAELIATV